MAVSPSANPVARTPRREHYSLISKPLRIARPPYAPVLTSHPEVRPHTRRETPPRSGEAEKEPRSATLIGTSIHISPPSVRAAFFLLFRPQWDHCRGSMPTTLLSSAVPPFDIARSFFLGPDLTVRISIPLSISRLAIFFLEGGKSDASSA